MYWRELFSSENCYQQRQLKFSIRISSRARGFELRWLENVNLVAGSFEFGGSAREEFLRLVDYLKAVNSETSLLVDDIAVSRR